MRRFASRPFAFSVLVTLAVFGLDLAIRAIFPRAPVGNIEKLPQDAFEPPVGLGLILSDMRSPDALFWALATVLALGLLVWTGWLREAGFNRMSQWRNLRLLLFPLLVCALTLCGGFTYGALRWRTTSIWPVIVVHTALAFAVSIATLGTVTYPLMMLLSTLGFVAYGLYLLRNPQVRADGGLTKPAPSRVR